MIISDCNFTNLHALNRSSDTSSDLPSGIAGAINYDCSVNDPDCSLTIDGSSIFSNNFAAIKGGAINWNYLEPILGKNL